MTTLPASLRIAVALATISALGTSLLAVAHTGVTVPLLSALGPQGGAVPPAVVAFTVATLLFAVLAFGLRRAARWAWVGGLVLAAASILGGVGQFRGVVSAIGIGLAVVLLGVLLAPSSRRAVGAPVG